MPPRRHTASRRPFRGRAGFSLPELLIVLTIAGILLAVGAPSLRRAGDRNKLRAARDEISAMVATARAAAIQKGRTGRVLIRGNTVLVTVDTAVGRQLVVVAERPMKELYGVDLAVAPAASDTMLSFDSRGFAATGSGRAMRIRVTGHAGVDSLCITRYGLVTKRGCLQ